MIESLAELDLSIERRGLVLSPDGDPSEREGVLNPASARTRDGALMLYPRAVAQGNISRVSRVLVVPKAEGFEVARDGFALEPHAEYEIRPQPGYGCEDPRVTFVPAIDRYVMAYTAFGLAGPRIALALSEDAITWERLGLMRFERPGLPTGDDKDAAFFPEPVLSPSGERCLAFYHRPMLHLSAVDGRAAIPIIERLPYQDRESIRIGYVPLEPVLSDMHALLDVSESVLALSPNDEWGSIKIGGGTPPVRIPEGWMSLYHAVDLIDNSGSRPKFRYSAGVVVHDVERPDRVLYRSPSPVLAPTTGRELTGTVDNVVFPTALDPRTDLGERIFDVYYGMADYSIGAARMTLH
ncbi:MAG: glycoside hydrolase family 130 protein [Vulcanimicrobiaceae bacterium]